MGNICLCDCQGRHRKATQFKALSQFICCKVVKRNKAFRFLHSFRQGKANILIGGRLLIRYGLYLASVKSNGNGMRGILSAIAANIKNVFEDYTIITLCIGVFGKIPGCCSSRETIGVFLSKYTLIELCKVFFGNLNFVPFLSVCIHFHGVFKV